MNKPFKQQQTTKNNNENTKLEWKHNKSNVKSQAWRKFIVLNFEHLLCNSYLWLSLCLEECLFVKYSLWEFHFFGGNDFYTTSSLSSAWMLVLGLIDSTKNHVLAKDIKSCIYCCYVICTILTVRVGGMPWLQNRRNSLPCTVRSCNQRVVCLVLYDEPWLRSMIYRMGLWTSARFIVSSLVVLLHSIKLL